MRATTILVAEASAAVRSVLRQSLAGQGFDVAEADEGARAVELCHERRPDAVLLGLEMPGLDGCQVLALLKSEPDLRDIPVVLLAGPGSTEDVVAGLRLGANDYLRTPFEAPEPIARVTAALRISALHDELRQRNEELDVLTRTDALTSLYNRRHLDEQLHSLASAAVRHRFPLGVLMVDIDNFREVNATSGHAVGDAVLCVIAARLRASVRTEDIVGRWGGEEFLALLPYADLAGAAVLAERLRQRVGGDPVTVTDGGHLHVTVSVGCAADDGHDPEGLLRQADRNLYRAKQAGRNRVEARPPE